MKELLLSEIKHNTTGVLNLVSLINHHILQEPLLDTQYFNDFADKCMQQFSDIDDSLERAETLLETLYVDEILMELMPASVNVKQHRIIAGFEARTMAPALKLILLRHVIRLCGFEADIVFVPENLMLRIVCDDEFAIIIDPMTGEAINWLDLDNRLADNINSIGQEYLSPVSEQSLIFNYLESLKTSLIADMKFDRALSCIDMIFALVSTNRHRLKRILLSHQQNAAIRLFNEYKTSLPSVSQHNTDAVLLQQQLELITKTTPVLH